MKIAEVRQRARNAGVKANGSKEAIIRRVQTAEGNEACFRTRDVCGQQDCCWREDCLPGRQS